ncbi:MAG: DUF2087 domain-containing protein [Anaerolineales bacterium]|nr:DUF2087 domain-containing protein [Anaerolineales bacterium]
MNTNPEMLDFLKAASDIDRLRIIGLLSQRRASRAQIAEKLNLSTRDLMDHLAFLEHAEVLTQKDEIYELNADKLSTLAREHFEQERPAAYVPAPDLDLASKKILKAYLNADGSIRQIPTQFEKLRVILNYLIQAFEPETNYKEKDVNAILRRFHEDTAGLRRDLVDANMLARESDGSRYWRIK